MKRIALLCCLAVGSVFAATEETQSKPMLAASVELAPFGDISKKVTTLGTIINNPIVPALLIGSGQQQIAKTYGRFRSDSPMYWQIYVQTRALDIVSLDDDLEGLCELVLVYPSADGVARMALNHPGSTKEADGTLHLLASEENPDERWVKFTADGKYCAFAKSAALANIAINDFAKSAAARKARAAGERPLVYVEITEHGISAVRSLQKNLSKVPCGTKVFNIYGSATFSLDLDDKGLSTETVLLPRPDAKRPATAGFSLPASVLDLVPANAPLFFFSGSQIQGEYETEAEFRTDLNSLADTIRTNLVVEVKKQKECQKYNALLDELASAISDLLREVPYPSTTDWASFALAFDGNRHPYIEEHGNMVKLKEANAMGTKFFDRIIAALERQWPGKKLISKLPDGIAIDWSAVIDVAAAESGVKSDGKEAKEIANAQQTIAKVLGGTKTELRGTINGTQFSNRVAAPEVKPSEAKPNGEARVAAALPEVAANRPGTIFYFSLYNLVREVVLPTMAKFAAKKDAAQYQTMITAMAPAEKNSAIAGATWTGKDGSRRTLVRLTASELKNFGAAFNAFTAASMSSALGDDEDDDK